MGTFEWGHTKPLIVLNRDTPNGKWAGGVGEGSTRCPAERNEAKGRSARDLGAVSAENGY